MCAEITAEHVEASRSVVKQHPKVTEIKHTDPGGDTHTLHTDMRFKKRGNQRESER